MRFKLKRPIVSKAPTITKLLVGVSYLGTTEAFFSEDGPVTVSNLYESYPEYFDLIDTISIKTQIMINLSLQYVELQKKYGFDEDGMAEKISEISEKICSKI